MKHGDGLLLLALVVAAFGGWEMNPTPPPRPPGRGRLTLAELRQLARAAGFPDPNLAAAIAMAESGGDPHATNIVDHPKPGYGREHSYGLWQINVLAWPMFSPGPQLYDPTAAAAAALEVSSGGTDWHWWSTYTSGAYKKYLGGAA